MYCSPSRKKRCLSFRFSLIHHFGTYLSTGADRGAKRDDIRLQVELVHLVQDLEGAVPLLVLLVVGTSTYTYTRTSTGTNVGDGRRRFRGRIFVGTGTMKKDSRHRRHKRETETNKKGRTTKKKRAERKRGGGGIDRHGYIKAKGLVLIQIFCERDERAYRTYHLFRENSPNFRTSPLASSHSGG